MFTYCKYCSEKARSEAEALHVDFALVGEEGSGVGKYVGILNALPSEKRQSTREVMESGRVTRDGVYGRQVHCARQ